MPMGTTSYLAGSSAFSSEAAEMSDTSCSPERPPNKTPSRIRLLKAAPGFDPKQGLLRILFGQRNNGL